MNELHLLHTLLPELPVDASVPVGPGDDCAVLDVGNGEQLLAAVDQLIGDVHYYTDGTAPEAAGAKLLKRNLSDIAAMGGIPRWALLTLASGGRDDDWLLRFARTVAREAAAYGVLLVGGDLAALPQSGRGEVATLTILGTPGAHQSLRFIRRRPSAMRPTLKNSIGTITSTNLMRIRRIIRRRDRKVSLMKRPWRRYRPNLKKKKKKLPESLPRF